MFQIRMSFELNCWLRELLGIPLLNKCYGVSVPILCWEATPKIVKWDWFYFHFEKLQELSINSNKMPTHLSKDSMQTPSPCYFYLNHLLTQCCTFLTRSLPTFPLYIQLSFPFPEFSFLSFPLHWVFKITELSVVIIKSTDMYTGDWSSKESTMHCLGLIFVSDRLCSPGQPRIHHVYKDGWNLAVVLPFLSSEC